MLALIRRRSTTILLAIPAGLTGCAGSPTQDVFGSFFPSWMVCAIGGLVCAAALHRIFAAAGVDKTIPLPFLAYLSLAATCTFALWLIWLG